MQFNTNSKRNSKYNSQPPFNHNSNRNLNRTRSRRRSSNPDNNNYRVEFQLKFHLDLDVFSFETPELKIIDRNYKWKKLTYEMFLEKYIPWNKKQ